MISRKKGNTIEIEFGEYCKVKAPPLFQHDKGQILRLLDIPDESVVEFSNKLNDKSKPYIVQNSQVAIPDFLLEENTEITGYVKFVDEKSETTVKVITIPVISKPESDTGNSPENQTTFIEQIQEIMNTTKQIAQSVRDDAANGKFGYNLTDEDREEISENVKSSVQTDLEKKADKDNTVINESLKIVESNGETSMMVDDGALLKYGDIIAKEEPDNIITNHAIGQSNGYVRVDVPANTDIKFFNWELPGNVTRVLIGSDYIPRAEVENTIINNPYNGISIYIYADSTNVSSSFSFDWSYVVKGKETSLIEVGNNIYQLLENKQIIELTSKDYSYSNPLTLATFCQNIKIGNIYLFDTVCMQIGDEKQYMNGYVIPQIISDTYGYNICFLLMETIKGSTSDTDKNIYRYVIKKGYYSNEVNLAKEKIATNSELSNYMMKENAYTKEQINSLLSGYVQNSRKIAGYSLVTDIDANTLAGTIAQEFVKGGSWYSSLIPWLMKYCGSKTQQDANTNAIAVLNGTSEGSVSKTISDALAQIIADAPEDLDTLKEISDWISNHADDASAMNSAIADNSKKLNELKTLVGQLPEGTSAMTIVSYIDDSIQNALSGIALAEERSW